MRSWLWSHVDEDAVTVDPHGIALQASTFGIHAVTGACVESPLVRSTGDDVAAECSGGKRVRQMGAPVIVGDHLPIGIAQQDVDGAKFPRAHLALPDVVQRPRVLPRHDRAFSLGPLWR